MKHEVPFEQSGIVGQHRIPIGETDVSTNPPIPANAKIGDEIGRVETCNCGRTHPIKVGLSEDGKFIPVVDTGWY